MARPTQLMANRTQRTGSRRPRRAFGLAAVVALTGAVLLGTPGQSDASSHTSTCVVAPEIHGVTINQGLPYTELAPGKNTLVRLFLQKPKCANTVDMQLTGAAITVRSGGKQHAVTSTVPALRVGDTTYPVVAPYGTFPVDHPGDPILVVPGSALAAGPLTVSATLSFRWRSSTNDPWTPGTTPSVDRLVSGAAMAATVGAASKPLRVLVVPMGDLAAGMASQFPPAATQAIENGMRTLSRLMPVGEGVGDLIGVSGGIRYRIAPTMIDLAALGLMPDGLFCGTEGNFPNIGRLLSAHLVAWNTANPAFAADRAIGAVWEGVSKGAPCAEGVGSYSTREGWVRAIADRPATDGSTKAVPSKTGALLGMEIQHTFGGVAPGAGNDAGNGHSKNFDADGGTQRAYHLTNAAYLPADLTVMRYASTGWDNTNTLLEQPDWSRAQCVLNPPLPGQTNPCPSGGLVGAPLAGRGPSIVVSGVTDGTASGTNAHSYVSDDVQRTPPAESEYTLVQFADDGEQVQSDAFAVGGHNDDHSHGGNDSVHTAAREFDVAVARHARSARFQLRKGTIVLYERSSGDVPEYVGATPATPTGQPVRVTDAPGDDEFPALSGDGRVLAWQDGAGVRLRLRAGGPVSAPIAGGTEPALDRDGSRLAYIRGGDLLVTDVTVTDGVPLVGAPRVVYDRSALALGEAPASAPSFGPGADVVVAISGDLWVIDTDFRPSLGNPLVCQVGALLTAPCRPLTSTAAVESTPSWGTDDTIAYERDGAVWTLEAASPGTTQTQRVAGAGDPAMAGGILAFTRGDSIAAVSAAGFGGEVVLAAGGARAAALAGDGRTLAFDRADGGQRDVYLLGLAPEGDSFVVRHPRASELRADVWAVSPSGSDNLVVALPPSAVDGDLATFTVRYDSSALPPGSTRRVQVSDGWSTATRDFGPPAGTARPPVTAVYTPSVGAEILQFDSIPLTGSARDASGVELEGANLRWFHRAPGETTVRAVGTGPRVEGSGIATVGHLDPPVGGWVVGIHTVTLRATDSAGLASETSVQFEILADNDRDGRPATREVRCPGSPTGGDDDPYDVFGDDDRDGILNGEDVAPCAPDVNVTTDFDPDSLYVPSSGTPVTVHLRGATGLSGIDPATVSIVQLGYHRLTTPLAASAWSFDRKTKTATAKFDRQQLTAALHERELVGGWVPIVLTGASSSFTFRGVDPSAPVTFPAP
jgi:hypothetical protein